MAGASARRSASRDAKASGSAALPMLDRHRPRGGPVRNSKNARRRMWVLVAVHVLVFAHIAQWLLTGSTMSPLEPSEAGQAAELGILNAGFFFFVALIVATLIFGRFFCGWACHVVAYQDAAAWFLGKLGMRPRPLRSRVLVWVPVLTAIVMFALPAVFRIFQGEALPDTKVELVTEDFWETFPGFWIGSLTFVVCGGLAVWFLGAKGFCTYGCPYGAVFGAVDRLATKRIRVTDACEGCGHCTAVCTSNVRVHEEVAQHRMVVDAGCMKCLDCVSVCPKDALYFGGGGPSALGAGARPRRAYDFGVGEELALGVVFLVTAVGLHASRWTPILLTVGASVIVALAAVLLWRLLRRTEVSFQSFTCKSQGRWKPVGGIVALGALALLGLSGTAGVNAAGVYSLRRGAEAFEEARLATPRSAAFEPALATSRVWLLRAERWLVEEEPARLHELVGTIDGIEGRYGEAESRMRTALERAPDNNHARNQLAGLLVHRGALDEAVSELEVMMRYDASGGGALETLRKILNARPDHDGARYLAVEMLIARGELAGARAGLAPLLARTPLDERTRELLDEIEARD